MLDDIVRLWLPHIVSNVMLASVYIVSTLYIVTIKDNNNVLVYTTNVRFFFVFGILQEPSVTYMSHIISQER